MRTGRRECGGARAMNDFLRELEAELPTASRRRSARRARPWWRRPPVPSPRPAVVAAAGVALLAIVLGIAVAALRGGGDARAAQPEPAATMPLTALVPLTSCSKPPETLTGRDVKGLTASLAVFRRAQREPD